MNFLRISRNLLREFFPALLVWIVGDLYVTVRHLTWDSSGRLAVDLILLLAVIAARFTALASRTREQLKWFFTPEVGGVCLFITLGQFAIYQSWMGAWQIAIELSFWFCLARICKLTLYTLSRIWIFALIPFYVVHNLVLSIARAGVSGLLNNLLNNGAGPVAFVLMLVAIMLGFARMDDRPHSGPPASPVPHD